MKAFLTHNLYSERLYVVIFICIQSVDWFGRLDDDGDDNNWWYNIELQNNMISGKELKHFFWFLGLQVYIYFGIAFFYSPCPPSPFLLPFPSSARVQAHLQWNTRSFLSPFLIKGPSDFFLFCDSMMWVVWIFFFWLVRLPRSDSEITSSSILLGCIWRRTLSITSFSILFFFSEDGFTFKSRWFWNCC